VPHPQFAAEVLNGPSSWFDRSGSLRHSRQLPDLDGSRCGKRDESARSTPSIAFDNPRTSALPGEVFLLEPRINEMEIMIDEHAIRLLRRGSFTDDEMRLVVAALKITNDLERIGDIAVNLAERVISLREMPDAKPPEELAPMWKQFARWSAAAWVRSSFRNAELAAQVLESDDVVDQYPRPHLREPAAPHDPECCARHSLPECSSCWPRAIWSGSRITPTNIAEDIIFWVRGLDVRHGRGLTVRPESEMTTMGLSSEVTENFHTAFIRM